jgi:hypothetical protein
VGSWIGICAREFWEVFVLGRLHLELFISISQSIQEHQRLWGSLRLLGRTRCALLGRTRSAFAFDTHVDPVQLLTLTPVSRQVNTSTLVSCLHQHRSDMIHTSIIFLASRSGAL